MSDDVDLGSEPDINHGEKVVPTGRERAAQIQLSDTESANELDEINPPRLDIGEEAKTEIDVPKRQGIKQALNKSDVVHTDEI